jgi:Phage Tail Protein X
VTILANSRYVTQPVLVLPNDDGSYSPTVFRGPIGLPATFYHYQIRQGDRFDIIANSFYGDSTLYWLIADANPEIFFPGGILTPGVTVRIPID